MPGYRAYLFDSSAHIIDKAELVCADDRTAIQVSHEQFPGSPVEVWAGDRLVFTWQKETAE